MPSRRPLRSLVLMLLCVIAAGTGPARGEDAPERVGNLGAPDRLVIRGLESFEVEQLRRPLLADHALLRFSGPKGSRATLLGEYARRAEQALRLTGLAEATVVPTVETIDGTEKLVLTVREGPRFDAGKVVVHGLPDDVAARLETRLRSPAPPVLASLETVRRADESTREVWRIADGSVATLSPALWPRSGPAPCDDATMTRVRWLVALFLQEEGYFDITPPRDPTNPAPAATTRSAVVDPGIEATLDTGDGREATLTVSVKRLPPKAWISRIDLPRGVATTPDEMAAFLGIAVGAPITMRSPVEWANRLRDSGRFIQHVVSVDPDLLEPGGQIVRFDIVEYEPMMPLSRPLSREEETMLRCRRWLFDALDDERDLVFTIEPTGKEIDWQGFTFNGSANANDLRATVAFETEEGDSKAHETPIRRSRLTISGSQAISLLAEGIEGEWHGIVASKERLRVVAPRGAGWLDVPFSIPLRLGIRPALTVSKPRYSGSTDDGGDLLVRLIVDTDQQFPVVGAGGVHVKPSVPPVFCSVLLHERSPRVHWEGDDLVVRHDDEPETRIDARTGRPRTLSFMGQKVTVEERPDALEEADRMAGSVGRSRFRPDRPLSSAVRFLFADGGWESARSLFAPILLGDQGLPTHDLDAERIARLARRLDDDDALAAIDGVVWRLFAPCPTDPQPSDLVLPSHGHPALGDRGGTVQSLAAAVWRAAERRLAPDTWPMILVRIKTGAVLRVQIEEMMGFLSSESHGPLAFLVAASMSQNARVTATFARHGLERATRDRFLADCRPLLEATSDLDLASLVRGIVRGLDDESLALVGGMLATDADALVAVARRLRESDVATSTDMEAILAAAWDGGLGEAVVRHLERFAAAGTEQKKWWTDDAGTTTTTGTATVTIDGVTRTFSSVKLNASKDGTSFSFEAK